MVVWQYRINAGNILRFHAGLEFYVSTRAEHRLETNRSSFRYDVPCSAWLAFIIYNAFWLGKYLFHVHKRLSENALHTHRFCYRYTINRGILAHNLHYNAEPLTRISHKNLLKRNAVYRVS